MTGPDYFTPSLALGYSISPPPGVRQTLQREEDFVNKLAAKGTG